MITKPISIFSLLIKVFSTCIVIVFFILIIYFRINNVLHLQQCLLFLLIDILSYILILGFAQIIQYLKDLVYLKEKSLFPNQNE